MIPWGIEPATFQFVEQRLNQLRHRDFAEGHIDIVQHTLHRQYILDVYHCT
jgi:hypothetical protein